MKTMIPNKLKFDLDLNDLLARVTPVSHEALEFPTIEELGLCPNARINLGCRAEGSVFNLIDYCDWRCSQLNGSELIRYKRNDSLFNGNTSCACGTPC